MRIITLIYEETNMALWILRLTDRSSKSNEVEVEREGLSLGDERGDPLMRLFCVHSLRHESEPFPDPKDMGVDWKGFPSHAEKQETMGGFRADSLETSDGLLDLFRIHFSQKGKAQRPALFFNPLQDFADAPRLLIG
jgi:hypothetical protein